MKITRLILFIQLVIFGVIPVITANAAEDSQSYDTSHFKVEMSFPDGDRSQWALNMAAGREFKRADDTLNDIYNKVLLKYERDQEFIDKFVNAELAWIKFRDAELEAIYPAQDKRRYGSIYPMIHNIEGANLTWSRVKQLNEWLTGFPEGVVGAGSRHH